MVGGFREFARGCTLAGGMQSRAVRMSHVSFSYGGSTVLVDANLSVELFWVTIDERAARLAGVRVTAVNFTFILITAVVVSIASRMTVTICLSLGWAVGTRRWGRGRTI